MSNTSNVMALMEKYSTTPVKEKKEENPHRVTVGNVFVQPTGGKNGKPFNFSYCYFGMKKDGQSIAGFSMSNKSMLEAVAAGLFSEDFATAFAEYAEKFAKDHVVMK